jgi:hypothetical protein
VTVFDADRDGREEIYVAEEGMRCTRIRQISNPERVSDTRCRIAFVHRRGRGPILGPRGPRRPTIRSGSMRAGGFLDGRYCRAAL